MLKFPGIPSRPTAGTFRDPGTYRMLLYRLLLPLIIAIILNPLMVRYQLYYIDCTVSPLSHQSKVTNQDRYTMEVEFVGLCAISALLVIINGSISLVILNIVCTALGHTKAWLDTKTNRTSQDDERRGRRRKSLSVTWKVFSSLMIIIVIILAFGFTFAHLFAALLAPYFVWQAKYEKSCDGLDVRVFLDSAGSRPASNVLFADLVSRSSYRMVMSPDPSVWGFDNQGLYNFSVVSFHGPTEERMGVFESIQYDLASSMLEARRDGEVYNSSFGLGANFSIPGFGMSGDIEPFSKRCVFDPTVEVFHSMSRMGKKRLVMKTTQFAICGELQVCVDREMKNEAGVVVGLLMLQRAGRPDKCCKGSITPGIDGRDSGRDGKG